MFLAQQKMLKEFFEVRLHMSPSKEAFEEYKSLLFPQFELYEEELKERAIKHLTQFSEPLTIQSAIRQQEQINPAIPKTDIKSIKEKRIFIKETKK
jgi:hypothetical protein